MTRKWKKTNMPQPLPFTRPEHPDFWWLSELIVQLDGESRASGVEGITTGVVDSKSLEYVAFHRAILGLGLETRKQVDDNLTVVSMLAGMYHEAFILGTRFAASAKRTADHRLVGGEWAQRGLGRCIHGFPIGFHCSNTEDRADEH